MKQQNKTQYKNKIAIIIPVYKEIGIIEKTSLDSLRNYLNSNRDIIIIGSDEKLLDEYSSYLNDKFYVGTQLFDKKYFKSTETYSELIKSYDFYNTFSSLDYMLIFQTDCILMNDNIDEWVAKDYDYVSAPILSNNSGWKHTPIVGNGGCSLRKVNWFLEVTNPNGNFINKYGNELAKEKSLLENNKNRYNIFEDVYFCELLGYYKGMKRPDYIEALSFCWDMNPDICYNITNGITPDFIHAFDKNLRWYDKVTNLKDKINDYNSLYNECENKYKELHKVYMKDKENPSTII